ncbi:MAG: 4Fe-4S dicluster domain-containing protein [Lentisphaerae bacterium]|nr:4Fe-4S dicluster domain-containing protein [Lentisphaerota bacterium]
MSKINIERADANFKYEVASHPGAENIKKCFSCGTCTGACPVFRVESDYNPRKIIRQILLGLRKEVLQSKEIWLCARCYSCTAHCPQGVSFADIIVVLREMAIQEGYAPKNILKKIDEITDCANEFRKDCINRITGNNSLSEHEIVSKVRTKVAGLR